MLSNNTILETRVKRLLDGLIFFCGKRTQRARAAHAQNELGLYTGLNLNQNICKNEGKLGTVFTKRFDKITIWCHLIFY